MPDEMTSVYPPNVNLDERGEPCGVFRDNQDPAEPDRLHPVPRRNASGEVIMIDGKPDTVMLPLDHQRTVEQLEEEGLQVEGVALVAIPGHPLTDPDVVEVTIGDVKPVSDILGVSDGLS